MNRSTEKLLANHQRVVNITSEIKGIRKWLKELDAPFFKGTMAYRRGMRKHYKKRLRELLPTSGLVLTYR